MEEQYHDPNEQYPIIWKKEDCFRGECKEDSVKHWWSIPFTASFGLASECFLCGKYKHWKINLSI